MIKLILILFFMNDGLNGFVSENFRDSFSQSDFTILNTSGLKEFPSNNRELLVSHIRNLLLWVDVSYGVHIISGTNNVEQWDNKVGKRYNIFQTNSIRQPEYIENDYRGSPSLYFDGTFNAMLTRSNNVFDFGAVDKISICAVFKTITNGTSIISKRNSSGNGWTLSISSTGGVSFLLRNSSSNLLLSRTSSVLSDDTFRFVAMTYNGSKDASQVKFYINKKDSLFLDRTIVGNNTLTLSPVVLANTTIGAENSGTQNNFLGNINKLLVAKTELTKEEVESIFFNFKKNYLA